MNINNIDIWQLTISAAPVEVVAASVHSGAAGKKRASLDLIQLNSRLMQIITNRSGLTSGPQAPPGTSTRHDRLTLIEARSSSITRRRCMQQFQSPNF